MEWDKSETPVDRKVIERGASVISECTLRMNKVARVFSGPLYLGILESWPLEVDSTPYQSPPPK